LHLIILLLFLLFIIIVKFVIVISFVITISIQVTSRQPFKVSLLRVVSTSSDSVSLDWDVDSSRLDFETYEISYWLTDRPASNASIVHVGNMSSTTVQNLAHSTRYTFQVRKYISLYFFNSFLDIYLFVN